MISEFRVRRFSPLSKNLGDLRATGNESIAVAQVEGPGDELTRAGRRFLANGGAATGQAPVQAVPTTAAIGYLFNAGAPTSPTAFLDVLGAMLNAGTGGALGTLYGCLCPPIWTPATRITASVAGAVVVNANPGSSRGSQMLLQSAVTLGGAPVAANWMPLAYMTIAGTLASQSQIETRSLGGTIAIPPGCGLGLTVVSPAGSSALWTFYAAWHEYETETES